eukprot:jgi/Chlat1/5895/Chrsp4S00497
MAVPLTSPPAALLLVLVLSAAAAGTMRVCAHNNAPVKEFDWEVTWQFIAPDCFEKQAVAVNGLAPVGPTIEVNQGDLVLVNVVNHLWQEGVSFHFMGIHNRGTPWHDGVPGVTQCSIRPGERFQYKFYADNAGTYWWHSHYAMQRGEAAYGFVIVHPMKPEPFTYDAELRLMFGDYYHASSNYQELGLQQKLPALFRWVGDSQAILFNGQGVFSPCTLGYPNATIPFALTVEPGKTYRLRLVNTGSLQYQNIKFAGHKVTIVEADGTYTTPVEVDSVEMNHGQRYSVLLTANQPADNYWISVMGRFRPAAPSGLAVLSYAGVTPAEPSAPVPIDQPANGDIDYAHAFNHAIRTRKGYRKRVPAVTRSLILVGTQNRLTDGRLAWTMNNISYQLPSTPLLASAYYSLAEDQRSDITDTPPVAYDYSKTLAEQGLSIITAEGNGVYHLERDDVVQVVLQNTRSLNGVSEQHPWYLHGHSFWIVGEGLGTYNAATDNTTFNLKDPILRDTVTLLPSSRVAIRWRADNPGVWQLHCHIDAHLFLGMRVAFIETPQHVPPPPSDLPLSCGKITLDFLRAKTGYKCEQRNKCKEYAMCKDGECRLYRRG